MEERIAKLREERIAREKARIEKLRDMNLKKYAKNGLQPTTASIQPNQAASSNAISQTKHVKNYLHVNGATKRPVTATANKPNYANMKSKVISKDFQKPTVNCKANEPKTESRPATSNATKDKPKNNLTSKPIEKKTEIMTAKQVSKSESSIPHFKIANMSVKPDAKVGDNVPKISVQNAKVSPGDKIAENHIRLNNRSVIEKRVLTEMKVGKEIHNSKLKVPTKIDPKRKSIALPTKSCEKPKIMRKSMLPKVPENTKCESVFERLYKPKMVVRKTLNPVDELHTNPNYLNKIIRSSGLITNKRHTIFETVNRDSSVRPRRSISAVHFKRISKSELSSCMHKWASNSDLSNSNLDVNEDDKVKEDKLISAIKSERKKVTFMTPMPSNFNTPRPDELQARLKSWLQKRGKSLDSYHHLQCFGVHLKMDADPTPNEMVPNKLFDEENKENIALDSDSDDGSYTENMNQVKETLSNGDKIDIDKWRHESMDSVSVYESPRLNETTLTSADTLADNNNVDELLIGALEDLTALLREGFDWQQSARWLRSIRERFPHARDTAAYWECRAVLENQRGDLPASVQCWEEAIAKGTERSVVEANLDQLLDKFMQLKISPQNSEGRQPDPKLLDVKNVFKSTIIRFAVQQAKLRRQSESGVSQSAKKGVFTVTPVRRSARLSHRPATSRTPLRVCDSVRQAATIAPQHIFTPNDNLVQTP